MFAMTNTHLSLWDFARILGMNPLHFAQVQIPVFADQHCDQVMLQYEWQKTDRVGREQIARCIHEAEVAMEQFLGWRLIPSHEVREVQPVVRPYRQDLFSLNARTLRGYPQMVEANWKKFISGGVLGTTLIGESISVGWSKANAWDWKPTGTVNVATSVTDTCEIAVYYPGHGGDERYRIRPIEVTIAGGIATITIRRELLVKEEVYEGFEGQAIDGLNDDYFLSEVDVWRRYNDTSAMANLVWQPLGNCGCGPVGGACPNCTLVSHTGCLIPRNMELSWVGFEAATWDADTEAYTTEVMGYGRAPDMIELSYYAGNRDQSLACPLVEMPSDMKRAVAFYAASMLDRLPCDCNPRYFEQMTEDLAFRSGITDEGAAQLAVFRINNSDLASPFGTRRGALEAWRWVNRPDMTVGRGYVRS